MCLDSGIHPDGDSPGPTIVSLPRRWHKPSSRWAIFLLFTVLALPEPAWGQATGAPDFASVDLALVGVAGAMFLVPEVLDITPDPPSCLPCARTDLPLFDRWVVRSHRQLWDDMSGGLVLGLAAATWIDLAFGRGGRPGHAMASAESAAIAVSLTLLLQRAIGRNRPVLYTGDAVELSDPAGQRRSWPSGHTATAFALATSYALSQSRSRSPALRYGALAVAGLVGGLRVAAARHFPSDAVGAAAVGIGSALLVHQLRF